MSSTRTTCGTPTRWRRGFSHAAATTRSFSTHPVVGGHRDGRPDWSWPDDSGMPRLRRVTDDGPGAPGPTTLPPRRGSGHARGMDDTTGYILVGYDGSPDADLALEWAAQ